MTAPVDLAAWNAEHPIGTPVIYWPGVREGAGILSKTRSAAWTLGHGDPVVSVEGRAGGIALTHVLPVPAHWDGDDYFVEVAR